MQEYAVFAWVWGTKWEIKSWVLEGQSREDEPWEAISVEQNCQLEHRDGPVVFPSSQPDKMYWYLRFHKVPVQTPGRIANPWTVSNKLQTWPDMPLTISGI